MATKIIKVKDCGHCPYQKYSALLYRTICSHEYSDCDIIKDLDHILESCPLPSSEGVAKYEDYT